MTHPDPKSALVGGHICLDILPEIGRLPAGRMEELVRPGELLLVGPAAVCTGGPVSNTGVSLHRLGIPTRLIAKVGADPLGELVRSLLEGFAPGLGGDLRTATEASTSYTIILSPADEDRAFLHYPGVNDTFSAQDIDYSLVAQADLFHFGYPPVMRQMYLDGGAGLAAVLQWAKQTGVTTSLDLTRPDPNSEGGQQDWRRILQAALPYVDIFLPSLDELLYTLRQETYQRLCCQGRLLDHAAPELLSDLGAELLALGVKIAGIKLGERGLYLRTSSQEALAGMGRAAPQDLASWAGKEVWSPCYQVAVVGTTGAGDATIAGFLASLLRGLPLEQAANMAVAVGACNVECADALSGVQSWEATVARVRAGWDKKPLRLEAPGWRWHPEAGLWQTI